MPRTHFRDFVRDNGQPVTVEYEVEGSYSPTTYSPRYGADGGDAPTFCIVDCWPNEKWFDDLYRRRSDLVGWSGTVGAPLQRIEALFLSMRINFARWRCQPTDAERERMEAHIAETYVEDDDYSDYEHDWR